MPDPYQRGSDEDWAKAEADELRHQLRQRDRRLAWERLLNFVLAALLGWVLFRFLQSHALSELWKF
jgi:uncharacterized membrane protein